MPFAGFPQKVRFTPVPNPLFGTLLEEIDDLGELKCTLRVIWLLHQKRGFPRYVTASELQADRVLARSLSDGVEDPAAAVRRSLEMAVRRGTLATAGAGGEEPKQRFFALNTEKDRRALAGLVGGEPPREAQEDGEALPDAVERPNIYALYEDNVGMLSPMIAEQLKEAEDSYPNEWIEEAFREAVKNNSRSWRYIAAILERWESEGREHGGTERHPKRAGYREYFRR